MDNCKEFNYARAEELIATPQYRILFFTPGHSYSHSLIE